MDKKLENSNNKNDKFPRSYVVKTLDPRRNIIQETKNMDEEIITENGKALISKKQVLEIALSVIPDLEDRYIRSFSLEKPYNAIILDGIPDDCWYIGYSSYTKSSGSIVLGSGMGIFINKYTGKIMYNGTLRGG